MYDIHMAFDQLKLYKFKFANYIGFQGVDPDNAMKAERFYCVF